MTSPRRRVVGEAVVVLGDDVDTDRIIPARFALAATFDGLGAHVFADDRRAVAAAGGCHPLDDPARPGPKVMVVGANFGCGSSREHAVAAIARCGGGIEALIGESYSVIFAGNCLANGLIAAVAERGSLDALRAHLDLFPRAVVTVDLDTMTASTASEGQRRVELALTMPESHRQDLRSGRWDTLAELLQRLGDARRLSDRLPYLTDYSTVCREERSRV